MSRIYPTNNRCQGLSRKGGSSSSNLGDDDNDEGAGSSCSSNPATSIAPASAGDGDVAQVLTVWKRSSMTFQGTDGFTVFDQHGRLAFRVDNYSRNKGHLKGGLVLMDGAGKPLITLKPHDQILMSMQWRQWNAYKGDHDEGACHQALNSSSSNNLLFSMRKSRSGLIMRRRRRKGEDEAQVFMGAGGGGGGGGGGSRMPDFRIEGSFRRRICNIRSGATGQVVAKISRKKANPTLVLGDDVFSLVVQPGFDSHLIMAFVMVLDRICVNHYFIPFLC